MSLQNVDIGSALRRLADMRIEEAMSAGKFNNLAGAGKPLNLQPLPAEEGARMMWWMLRIMKQDDFTPHEIAWRKSVDHLKQELDRTGDESRTATLVNRINALVHKVNTLGTNALSAPLVCVSLQAELDRKRAKQT